MDTGGWLCLILSAFILGVVAGHRFLPPRIVDRR